MIPREPMPTTILSKIKVCRSESRTTIRGNSQNIRVWKDSWISLSEQIKPCGPIHETSLDLRVSDLLTSDLQWNKSRIEEILPDFNAQIQCLKPSKEGAEDIFVWLTIQTGVYTTREVCISLYCSGPLPDKPRDTAEPKPRRKKKTQLFDIRPPRKVQNEPKPQILENESEDRTRKRTEEHTSETDPSQAKPRISTSSQTQPIHHKKQEINTR
ncbi:hypothetical protein F2Q69_00019526 [Brassica cretica]|uniref:Uncharacterized protein n=1 Tax=Brassica cretica TaxID=69181 RepID=A0A8S9QCE3_BRACR|nr:hypothetical protein F2Q69_00019526 [Brassica cretica]